MYKGHFKHRKALRTAILCAIIGLSLLSPGPARAACTSPAGQAGQLDYYAPLTTYRFCDGTSWIDWGGGAAGADGEIQFNSGGAFWASGNFTYDGTTLEVTSPVATTNGIVRGVSTASSGLAYGVYGESAANTVFAAGVYGTSVGGFGVIGSGGSRGVYGETSNGYGVYGYASALSGSNTGVYGATESTNGTGVVGIALNNTGTNYGVEGSASSPNGTGVYGYGGSIGVYGESDNYGVYAAANTPAGYGGYFTNWGGGAALYSSGNVYLMGGNVGIGTSSPVSRLDVDSANTASDIYLHNSVTGKTTADGVNLTLQNSDFYINNREAGNMNFYVNGAQRAIITSAGKVGIGTASPVDLLHISGSVASGNGGAIRLTNDTSGHGVADGGQIEQNGLSLNIINKELGVGGPIRLYANTTHLMTANTTGVGIMNTAPSYPLDVTGDMRFTGTLQGGTVPWARISGAPAETDPQVSTLTNTRYCYSNGTAVICDRTAAQLVAYATGGDGAGSGLDADLLDGVQGADYTRADLTYLGRTGATGLDGVTDTAAEWSNLPIGYSQMMNSTIGTAGGAPVNNYGYFTKVANRNVSGGWGGLWAGYSAGENYIGRASTNLVFAQWDKLWNNNNDGAGSGLDADLLDGISSASFVQTSRTVTGGTGLSGGGALSANQTLTLDTAAIATCTNATTSKLYWDSTNGRLTCGTDQDSAETDPQVSTLTNTRYCYSNGSAVICDRTAAQLVAYATGGDGAGSGLDADLLDGISSASFLRSDVADTGTNLTLGGLTLTGTTLAASGSSGIYGSLSISGSKNGYSGIHFPTTTTQSTLMVRDTDGLAGMYKDGVGWSWYFTGTGVLTVGTVPWARLSGYPSVIAGNQLTGGGALSGNVTLNVSEGAGSGLDADLLDGISSASFVQTSRTVTGGTGLTGGGALSANQTLSLNTAAIATCTNATTQKLIWDSTNGRLTCATDQTGAPTCNWTGVRYLDTCAGVCDFLNTTTATCTGGVITAMSTATLTCPRCTCFSAGTLVALADGSLKNIEDVIVGDRVRGMDGRINTVLALGHEYLKRHKGQFFVSINGGDAFMTNNHPVLTTDGWKAVWPASAETEAFDQLDGKVGQLETGDRIIRADGSTLLVKTLSMASEAGKIGDAGPVKIYSLYVDGNHSFIANDWVVHGTVPDAAGRFQVVQLF